MSSGKNKDRKITEEVRDLMRLHRYSIHTERSYCDWIKRVIQFHKMKSWDGLKDGEFKIGQFLTHLAEVLRRFPISHTKSLSKNGVYDAKNRFALFSHSGKNPILIANWYHSLFPAFLYVSFSAKLRSEKSVVV